MNISIIVTRKDGKKYGKCKDCKKKVFFIISHYFPFISLSIIVDHSTNLIGSLKMFKVSLRINLLINFNFLMVNCNVILANLTFILVNFNFMSTNFTFLLVNFNFVLL